MRAQTAVATTASPRVGASDCCSAPPSRPQEMPALRGASRSRRSRRPRGLGRRRGARTRQVPEETPIATPLTSTGGGLPPERDRAVAEERLAEDTPRLARQRSAGCAGSRGRCTRTEGSARCPLSPCFRKYLPRTRLARIRRALGLARTSGKFSTLRSLTRDWSLRSPRIPVQTRRCPLYMTRRRQRTRDPLVELRMCELGSLRIASTRRSPPILRG